MLTIDQLHAFEKPARIQYFDTPYPYSCAFLREDEVVPAVSGNKWRKLKYNLLEASNLGFDTLLTYGGAFSNHILATAEAGHLLGFKTIGVIRGDELWNQWQHNPTLQRAHDLGMQFEFVTRTDYRFKDEAAAIKKLEQRFGAFYRIPEGGTNALAVQGCQEILTAQTDPFDFILTPVGTGGTISGLAKSLPMHQEIIGFCALDGAYLAPEIRTFVPHNRWSLNTDFTLGGYGKINADYIRFLNAFYDQTGIPLDPVYTGKMTFGLFDLMAKNAWPANSRLLLIHTGGLQGIQGMNQQLLQKKKPILHYEK
ncbi:MAG: 1-aminocyclopropane-1-carboxylate deaminase [Flavobacterium sp. BFFFF2]|nr:MAG: 1-aminocyclopropane-1-carboxylate deaminase [Flavobacterium sp. BFFFF2]